MWAHHEVRAAVVVLLWLASSAAAHEQSLHKGPTIDGEIVSVSQGGFTLRTRKGPVAISFTEDTSIQRGEEAAARQDLRPGNDVSVLGTTLASGEVVAREIVIHGGDRGVGRHPAASPHP